MQAVVIIGAGGHAHEILEIIESINEVKPLYEVYGLVVEKEYLNRQTTTKNISIIGGFDWLANNSKNIISICGVGYPHYRFNLIKRMINIGCKFASIIHPSAIISKSANIGEGVIIAAGTIITSNVDIHDHVHVNLNCSINHDSSLHNYVTLSPGTRVAGNVNIQEGVFVGIGANLIEKLNIGKWSTIGAGSTVVNDVKPNSTVVGVPAKMIKTKEDNWYLCH